MIQEICPLMKEPCKRKECAIWDENWNECGILSISEGMERLVDVLIESSKK
jgi:hypothetical protein